MTSEEKKTMFLYIKNSFIVGCLIAEYIDKKDIVDLPKGKFSTDVLIKKSNKTHVNESLSNIKLLGIRQIWVNHKYRRAGIASKLCDSARANFTFGKYYSINECAFSQPTNMGASFAFSYLKSDNINIYS